MKVQRVEEGDEVRRKVDCQGCGQPKIEGDTCDAETAPGKVCGWPQLEIHPTEDGRILIFLPLCPSTNDRQTAARMGRFSRLVLTEEARDYVASVGAQLKPLIVRAIEELGWKPITRWQGVELWTILPRTSADCHNYGKVLFDALEAGGVTWNDKYLMPDYRGLWHDTKIHCLIVKA